MVLVCVCTCACACELVWMFICVCKYLVWCLYIAAVCNLIQHETYTNTTQTNQKLSNALRIVYYYFSLSLVLPISILCCGVYLFKYFNTNTRALILITNIFFPNRVLYGEFAYIYLCMQMGRKSLTKKKKSKQNELRTESSHTKNGRYM